MLAFINLEISNTEHFPTHRKPIRGVTGHRGSSPSKNTVWGLINLQVPPGRFLLARPSRQLSVSAAPHQCPTPRSASPPKTTRETNGCPIEIDYAIDLFL